MEHWLNIYMCRTPTQVVQFIQISEKSLASYDSNYAEGYHVSLNGSPELKLFFSTIVLK